MPDAADIQQALDTAGYYQVPAATPNWDGGGPAAGGGVFEPSTEIVLTTPVFLDAGALTGPGPRLCRLNTSFASFGVIATWKRGLISTDHYQHAVAAGTGFRLKGDCYLYSIGGDADLGPFSGSAHTGYGGSPRVRLRYTGTLNSGSWAGDDCVFGLNGAAVGPDAGRGYGPLPWPYMVYWGGDCLRVAVRTADDVVRIFRITSVPLSGAPAVLTFDITVNLAAGALTGTANGSAIAVAYDLAGAGWASGLTLAANHRWPFAVGCLDPYCNSRGYWGCVYPTRDVTITQLRVDLPDANNWYFDLLADRARPATYSGGPTLPLATVQYPGRSGYWLVTSTSQPGSYGGPILIRDLTLYCQEGGTLLSVGGYQGDLRVEGVRFEGGSRAVNGLRNGVAYTVRTNGCQFNFQRDRVFDQWAMIGSHSNAGIGYWGRRVGSLYDSYMSIENIFYAPGAPAVWEQEGNAVRFAANLVDFESPPYPEAVVEVTGDSTISASNTVTDVDILSGHNQPYPVAKDRGSVPGYALRRNIFFPLYPVAPPSTVPPYRGLYTG